FARENLPDHGDLLADLVRWAAGDTIPLEVQGPGLIDCHLFNQFGRIIVHLVNLTNAGTWRAPVEELISIGPFRISVKLPRGRRGGEIRALVSGRNLAGIVKEGWVTFEIKSITDHEVVVIA